ncbi:MAG TPA: HAMP domain-containing histidine kinase, partial [Phycisphaerales bacterium]|nr:HAMP domain-containing histidine kinase [Phycisphaerales bacterium]
MENLLQTTSLVERAQWLVRLRWVAIGTLAVATLVAGRVMGIALPTRALHVVTAVLIVYNFVLWDFLKYSTTGNRHLSVAGIGAVLTLQMCGDLLILTTILHFSGGIENPFAFFFVFHMILASIMRSRLQSYLQAALAVLLFGGMAMLEYHGVLAHHPLTGFADHDLYRSLPFIAGTLFVFAGTLFLVVYMTSNISEQLKKQQDGLARANAQLKEKDKLKNEYVLRLTHDIKGHLAAIESCLNLVDNEIVGPLNAKQKDLVARAYRRTSKCMQFVTAMLRLTRMKLAGTPDMEEFSLRNTIVECLATVRNSARSKGIELTSEIADDIEKVRGEAVLIEETITNLLFNALRYTPDGGKVHLAAFNKGAFIQLEIRDSGIGIPEGEQEKIFDEFYRAANARLVEPDGTGLGLSFARQVVERHGGRIWAGNNP